MIHGKSVLALVPARGGSKGLPGKNIRPLLGKPLIAWTIEQGLQSSCIDELVVSTDSEEIADISRRFGAQVPFLRPAELASDTASSIDVVLHALDFYESNGRHFDILMLLEPTSPLRDVIDIDQALEKLATTSGAESIVGVADVLGSHPAFLFRQEGDFLAPYLSGSWEAVRRQDITQYYFLEGTVYAALSKVLRIQRAFITAATLPHIVSRFKSHEIDELSDFIVVEALLRAKQEGLLE